MKITIRDLAAPSTTTRKLTDTTLDLSTAPYAILTLRVSLGILFLAHGLLKVFVFTLPGTAQFFTSVGVPGLMATPVALAEIVGGGMLVAGIYTRWVALALFPILVVATFKVHGANGWLFTNPGGGWEFPALFGLCCVVLFMLGDGAWAVGSIFHRKHR